MAGRKKEIPYQKTRLPQGGGSKVQNRRVSVRAHSVRRSDRREGKNSEGGPMASTEVIRDNRATLYDASAAAMAGSVKSKGSF